MFRVIITVLGMGLLSACVGNKPYHLGGIADEFYPNQKPQFEQTAVSSGRNYRLSFVEFDERGDFWDRKQLGDASRTIRNAKKPVLLVTFIHGWHNNAASGDVETFRCLLSELAISESLGGFQVHGVFLGWRGRVLQGPLDYVTFLDRKAAATRVAGTPITETIFELIRQARKAHPDQSKCVVIGHSFGGLVLEKAMAQALTGGVLAQDVQTGGKPFDAPADLILLVNSATESIYAKEMSDMFARIGNRDSVNPNRPLLISITSKSDSATHGWFPIGTFLPNLFAHRRYHWDPHYGTDSYEVDQHEYLTKTPGNNPRLFTHRVLPEPPPPDAFSTTQAVLRRSRQTEVCIAANPAFEENLRHSHGTTFATSDPKNPNEFKWWKLVKIDIASRTPYWILQVPDEIIHEHSPIFTPGGRAMMAALFRISNPESSKGPREMRLSP
jgi:pimeloyl-ACP methyl ester carboxylesterase